MTDTIYKVQCQHCHRMTHISTDSAILADISAMREGGSFSHQGTYASHLPATLPTLPGASVPPTGERDNGE